MGMMRAKVNTNRSNNLLQSLLTGTSLQPSYRLLLRIPLQVRLMRSQSQDNLYRANPCPVTQQVILKAYLRPHL